MEFSIKNKLCSASIDSLGAQLVSFCVNGKEHIRKRDEVWSSCSPILFPIVGLLKDNYTMIDGNRYEMGSHGFLRRHELVVIRQSTDSICFMDKYSEDSLKMWPFKYEMYVTFTLVGKKLDVRLRVKNVDSKTLAYNIGGHPGVICPMNDKEKFEDYKLVFSKKETFDSPSINGNCLDFDHPEFKFDKVKEIQLDYKYFDVDAIVLEKIKSNFVKLENNKGQGYIFRWEGFKTVAFWTKPNQKYLCFEPWQGYADLYTSNHDFYTKPDLIYLAPNKEHTVSYSIEVM